MFKQVGITALLVASVSAACWSESQGNKEDSIFRILIIVHKTEIYYYKLLF